VTWSARTRCDRKLRVRLRTTTRTSPTTVVSGRGRFAGSISASALLWLRRLTGMPETGRPGSERPRPPGRRPRGPHSRPVSVRSPARAFCRRRRSSPTHAAGARGAAPGPGRRRSSGHLGHHDGLGLPARLPLLVVADPEHPDNPGPNPAARKGRVLEQHQGIQRLPVGTLGPGHKAVVGRETDREDNRRSRRIAPRWWSYSYLCLLACGVSMSTSMVGDDRSMVVEGQGVEPER
jgi:hypothetical protein